MRLSNRWEEIKQQILLPPSKLSFLPLLLGFKNSSSDDIQTKRQLCRVKSARKGTGNSLLEVWGFTLITAGTIHATHSAIQEFWNQTLGKGTWTEMQLWNSSCIGSDCFWDTDPKTWSLDVVSQLPEPFLYFLQGHFQYLVTSPGFLHVSMQPSVAPQEAVVWGMGCKRHRRDVTTGMSEIKTPPGQPEESQSLWPWALKPEQTRLCHITECPAGRPRVLLWRESSDLEQRASSPQQHWSRRKELEVLCASNTQGYSHGIFPCVIYVVK